ncbi:cyclic nucleotide-binding domain-containing protein [Ilumatobacter sp.]|uniref:cyclic nucleotide-binding domain-containing protein n=1 Tax=Ilumatobacter sp. TaxID=1967498 RepID=UPI0037510503
MCMEIEEFRSIALFEGLTDDELAQCTEPLKELEMVAGSSLAKQDDFAYKFFIVLDGEVDVHRDFEFVASIGPGEFFGETALVKGEKRNARVTTHTRCRLACMMGWEFKTMTEKFPSVAAHIDAAVAEREA